MIDPGQDPAYRWYLAITGQEPELDAAPVLAKPLMGFCPPGHCPLHQNVILMPERVRVTSTGGGDVSLVGEGESGWCSQCSLEVEWARQRPHLNLVSRDR